MKQRLKIVISLAAGCAMMLSCVCAGAESGAARWAMNSWAPCTAWKTINGQDKFFLYFANSGGGIGVLTADSPVGPFTDPIGKALVSRKTPTCDSVTWLFDPAVLVDEDGSAYLYFGGGVPEGKQADPGTARSEKAARIEVIPDSLGNEPIATLEIPASETDMEVIAVSDKPLTGIHDIYFRFSETGTALVEWQFEKK